MKKIVHHSLLPVLAILLLTSQLGLAQLANDECFGAIRIDNVNNWCSAPQAFNNTTATLSSDPRPSCFPQEDFGDVWFFFVAQGNAVNLRAVGNVALTPGGTLNSPQLALYSGNCQAGLTEVECISDAFNDNIAETFATQLIPGGIYYIRVSARSLNIGTFQLCVNSFNEVPEPSGDCITGVLLCDKSPFSVDFIVGGGNNVNEILDASCLVDCGGPGIETGSTWYKWTCKDSGTLGFSLTPNNPADDLDFVVYELPNGVDNCNGKQELRCMTSGENVGAPLSDWVACTGATGLSLTDSDQSETCGCQTGDNNFAQAINMVTGRSYALVVNNYSNSGNGFAITFDGTGTFLGPEADFRLDPPFGVECDESLTITDESSFAAGNIVNYFWSFGEGAIPATATTQGPHTVVYESFGPKFIALTIESDGGCIVTEILEIEVEECCRLSSDIGIDLVDFEDPICPNTATGFVEVVGTGGDPFYNYSINGGLYQPSPLFNMLPEGDYQVVVQDIKGCRDSLEQILVDPPPLTVDAGTDIDAGLGETIDLNAVAFPPGDVTSWLWDPSASLSCSDCPDPSGIPPGTTTYTVTVSNSAGCTASDQILIRVSEERPIYIPNAISPNGDGFNDYFTLYSGIAAREIEMLRVFNRWGALMFETENIALGEETLGWDGTFKGEEVGPGVYVFYATVAFVDNVVILYEGSINVIK